MDYIYLPIVQRFKDNEQLFIDCGLEPIKHFDRFKGQYLNPELHQPWHKPALFFKFNITWEDQSNLVQHGKGILEVHLELENYGESYDGSPDQNYALNDYEYQRLVYVILQGFQTADFTRLKRRSTDEDENPSNTNVTIIRFDFEITDESAERFKGMIKEKLDDMETEKLGPEPDPVFPEGKYIV